MADREDDLSTFDVLGALPTLDESRIIAAQAVQSLAYSPLGTGRNSGLSAMKKRRCILLKR